MPSPNGQFLVRDDKTGAFCTEELAEILQAATQASASAFKARGIPEVLRVIEILGIEEARQWGTCTVSIWIHSIRIHLLIWNR